MLEIARRKAPGLRFEEGDALKLAYPDGSFDAVTVGFGARNFADLDRGLGEMARVTRPGGRVVVLEITTPQKPPLSWFFRAWFDRVVPLLGRIARPGRVHVPAEQRPAVSRTGGAGRPDGGGGARRRALDPHGGRDHRHSLGDEGMSNTAQAQLGSVLAAGGSELAQLLEHTEDAARARHGGSRGRARPTRRRDARRGRKAAAARAGVPVGGAGRQAPCGGRGGRGAAPHGDARPRRRAGRCRPSARQADRVRQRRPRRRHGHRRPALLARVRGARRHRQRGGRAGALDARRRRSRAAS